jgi:hypothetical protein
VGEVGFGDEAAFGLHVGGELPGDLAVVEVARIGGDALQCRGKIGLAEGVASAIEGAGGAGLEDAPGFREFREAGIVEFGDSSSESTKPFSASAMAGAITALSPSLP